MSLSINRMRNQAADLINQERWLDASLVFEQLCERVPTAEHQQLLASAYFKAGKYNQALAGYSRLASDNNRNASHVFNVGLCNLALGEFSDAKKNFEDALAIDPGHLGALLNGALAFERLGQIDRAEELFQRAVLQHPDSYEAHFGLGNIFRIRGKGSEALTHYAICLKQQPADKNALFNSASIFEERFQVEKAIEIYKRCCELDSGFKAPYLRLGIIFSAAGKTNEAITYFEKFRSIDNTSPECLNGLALCYWKVNRIDRALKIYRQAIQIDPENKIIRAHYIQLRTLICDFSVYSDAGTLTGNPKNDVLPFAFLTIEDNPEHQLIRSRAYLAERRTDESDLTEFKRSPASQERIVVGYFSADFKRHATMFLFRRVLEIHDASKFKIIVYNYTQSDSAETVLLGLDSIDTVRDISKLTDSDIVDLARSDGVDIAVDLKGFTESSRTTMFSRRMAPIQVNFLGYPGSIGADWMDYIIADEFVIPQKHEHCYAEKVARLPNSYQPNDDTRVSSDGAGDRSDYGLPKEGTIFCCFNQSYKITPVEIAVWAQILDSVPGSIIWLYRSNRWAEQSIKVAFQDKGVCIKRIIFADHIQPEEHLARLRHADIFLDTFNVNAHTTASDALWVGVPIITLPGDQFAARVAGSLAVAAGVPEMVVASRDEYIHLAIRLANDVFELSRLRSQLLSSRESCPLFNTKRYTEDLESLYTEMYAIWSRGEKKRNISLDGGHKNSFRFS